MEVECGLCLSVILRASEIQILYQLDPPNLPNLVIFHIAADNGTERTNNVFEAKFMFPFTTKQPLLKTFLQDINIDALMKRRSSTI